jgi:GNAT superfamily N-acetyltransferase
MLLSKGLGVIFKWEENGRVVGLIGAILSSGMFDGKVVAQEAFWFVSPEFRGHSGGIRLFKEVENWAQLVGVERLFMTYMHSSMPEKLQKFYERQGFVALETSFIKEITSWQPSPQLS